MTLRAGYIGIFVKDPPAFVRVTFVPDAFAVEVDIFLYVTSPSSSNVLTVEHTGKSRPPSEMQL